jgi:ubiquinone/menaquinone biosynthesis C-methylase UbiE
MPFNHFPVTCLKGKSSMFGIKGKRRQLHKSKKQVTDHWRRSHEEKLSNYDHLMRQAKYELNNFTWIATVNTFIEQGKLSNEKKVLDVGFGWGRTIVGLKKQLPDIGITGIELAENCLKNANRIFKIHIPDFSNIKLELGDAEALQYEENSFDAVLSTRVFQFLTNPQRSVNQIFSVLRPGGKAVVMVPNKINPYQFLFYHSQLISSLTLKKWFKNSRFKNIQMGSIIFFPAKLYRFSSDSPWVKFERFLTKIPIINKFGGIVWIRGEK